MCLKNSEKIAEKLCPSHYWSTPDLNWDTKLQITKNYLISDPDTAKLAIIV